MALSAWCTSFNTGTGAVSSTVSITGQASQAKALLLWWNGRTGTVDASGRATHQRGFGCAVSSTDRRRANSLSQDTPTSMVTNRAQDDAECVALTTTADAVDGLLDFQSHNSDGATFVVDDQFTASYRVHALGIGGADLSDVVGGNFTKQAGTGDQDITSLAWEPGLVIFFSSCQTGMAGTVAADSSYCIGAACSSSQQFVLLGGSNDGAATSNTVSYCTDAECIALPAAAVNSTTDRATFVGTLSNGFRINWLENAGSSEIVSFLAFRGAGFKIASGLTQTDTTTDVVISTPFVPRAGMVFSHCMAESTADTVQDDDVWSVGGFSSTSDERCMSVTDDDAAGTAIVSTGVSHDAVYQHLNPADGTVLGEMVVQAMGSSSVTFRMSDADNAQNFFATIIFGDRPLAPPPFQRTTRILSRRI